MQPALRKFQVDFLGFPERVERRENGDQTQPLGIPISLFFPSWCCYKGRIPFILEIFQVFFVDVEFSLHGLSDWAAFVFFNPKKRWEFSQIPNSNGEVPESKELGDNDGSKDLQRCLPSPATPIFQHKSTKNGQIPSGKPRSDRTSFSVGFSCQRGHSNGVETE